MGNGTDHPEIPGDVQTILARLNQLSGNLGTSARLDWTDQTLSVVGQLGRDPATLDGEDAKDVDFMLDMLDSQVHSVVIDEYDLAVIDSHVGDGGFRYELDVSDYLNERPYVLNIPFDDDLQDEPPERYKEYLERKDDDRID